MDVSTIQQLISTVGFPIVCCGFLAWFIYKAFEKITAQSREREEKLYSIVADAQKTNETLLKTNSDFVEVLNTYKTDLDVIKADVTEIKENLKG
jgi:cell division protein FtsB